MSLNIVLAFILFHLATSLRQKGTKGSFEVIGSSGVPAMHAALLQNGKVVFLDKIENYTELKLPSGYFAYSSVFDPETKILHPISVGTNPFCCGGAFLEDGRLLTVGGNGPLKWLDPTVEDGFDAIRYLDLPSSRWLDASHKLSSKRWYPSVQVLPDGRVFVAAGSLNGLDIRLFTNNNPTYEILDKTGQRKSSQIFSIEKNSNVRSLPELPGMYRTYPNTGGSVILPLSKEDNYAIKIMICGGGAVDDSHSPTDQSCGTIQPLAKDPKWQMTSMPGGGRGMVEGIALLDGSILWLNGAQRGCQGFGTADLPALEALIYHPKDNRWTTAGKSEIPRLYHSVALMLLDGRVLIAGSNPNEMPILLQNTNPRNPTQAFPTEFRVELYTPPYLQGKQINDRPKITRIEKKTLKLGGGAFAIQYQTSNIPGKVEVILYHGGFVTHALHMGQVMVKLEQRGKTERQKGLEQIFVRTPRIALAPGPYVIYIVVDGVPSIGEFVSVIP